MADTWLMFPVDTFYATIDKNVDINTANGTLTATNTKTFTIPNLNLTYSGIWLYQKISRTAYTATHCSFNSSGTSRVEYTNYNTDYSNSEYYTFTSPGKGSTITIRGRAYAYNIKGDTVSSYANVKVQYKFETCVCIGVTLPTRSEKILASEVNSLANILGVSTVSQGSAITKAGLKNIGDAIGTKVYATWNKVNGSNSSLHSAVSIDNTSPKASDFDSCITALTNNFVYR